MTIETMSAKSRYVYRISPDDETLVERKENKHGSRWYFYARRDTANEAKAALLKLASGGASDEPKCHQ